LNNLKQNTQLNACETIYLKPYIKGTVA